MRLLTWNVAGRVTRQPEQLAAVAGVAPDVVALQEVTKRTLPAWREGLAALGLSHVASPLDEGPPPKPPPARRPHRRPRPARAGAGPG